MILKKCKRKDNKLDVVLLLHEDYDIASINIFNDDKILNFISKEKEKEKSIINVNLYTRNFWLVFLKKKDNLYQELNNAREEAFKICNILNSNKIKKVLVQEIDIDKEVVLAFLEALALSNYKFLKYKAKNLDKERNSLQEVKLLSKTVKGSEIENLQVIIDAVYYVRDLVNTPYNDLNSLLLVEKIKGLAKDSGFKVEVLDKRKIEALRMGGLLAVNKGSDTPPTFSILKWKPPKTKNQKPIVLVGKGIVFDSGGLNLKPTGYMEDMKSDMAGAAVVIGVMYAISKLRLPVYVIGLVPSTDNAIGNKSYAPGDVITMHNGMTVEVLNTDAEGRLILADALSYASKYEPELVIDLATLTGAAMRALGHPADALFAKVDHEIKNKLLQAGEYTYERLVEFPLWEEYDKMLKSDIADIKNIGEVNAGAITAAKFLEHFTDYNWIHIDIAPNAFLSKKYDFRGKGATAVGVRLLVEFIKKLYELT